VGHRNWTTRTDDEDPHVVLLAMAGRMGLVSATSAHPEAALALLAWLSGDQMSPQVCAASQATTLFRRAQVKSPRPWTESNMSDASAVSYAVVTQQALSREQWLCALRIPGRAEYLAALDDAVATAIDGKLTAMDALIQAAKRWQQITERLGVDAQRSAYTHAVGLE
jgi:multiple sugar transport system substrate-binding protein